MEYIVLSLLMMRHMTIYELRSFIQKNLDTVCSDSFGSIQTALKKLLEKDAVQIKEYNENGMLKKEYHITDTGFHQFLRWIETPVDISKAKNMEGSKFFFLGLASKQVRIKMLSNLIQSLKEEQGKLRLIQQQVLENQKDIIQNCVVRIQKESELIHYLQQASKEDDLKNIVTNIYTYQIHHLEYGLKQVNDDIQFYQNILHMEE